MSLHLSCAHLSCAHTPVELPSHHEVPKVLSARQQALLLWEALNATEELVPVRPPVTGLSARQETLRLWDTLNAPEEPASKQVAVECTGAQAGLSSQQQIQLVLTTLHRCGGSATMDKLYDAVALAMAPHRLSANGKAAIRCFVNRTCVKQGWVAAHTVARQTAQWCLTPAGRAQVVPATPVPLPRPKTFAEPLLRALGKLSGHTLAPMPRHDAMRAVLAETGHNPDALPCGWTDLTSNGQPKIHESLRWLVRSMSTLVVSPTRGQWMLTQQGLDRAAKLNGVPVTPVRPKLVGAKQGPNATSRWFSQHLTPAKGQKDSELMLLMKGALRRHLPLSASRGLIEDHIQNFMVRVIRRDSFASALAAGEAMVYSKVASYCVNSGRSDARDLGTDPVSRELFGARTDKERQVSKATPTDFAFADLEEPSVLRDTDGNFIVENQTGLSAEHAFEVVWEQIVEVVKEAKPAAWKRYSGVLMLKVQGYSTQEIAEKEGVSKHRAARMLAVARQIVRDSPLSFAA